MSGGLFEELAQIGQHAGHLLIERGQTVAVVEGATGGLISASLVSLPGATAFFRGGGVIYSLRSRKVLLGLERAELEGMVSATERYALVQAHAIRKQFRADWGLAETGSAGPGTHPLGVANGSSAIALVGPDGKEWSCTVQTQSHDRTANMAEFARTALNLLVSSLSD